MSQVLNRTSLKGVDIEDRRAAIRTRREHLGMTKAGLAKLAGVDRGKLQRFEDGEDSPSARWIANVERALDDFEKETGHDQGEALREQEPIRITFHDVYGIGEIIVEGPADRPNELTDAIAKLLADLRNRD